MLNILQRVAAFGGGAFIAVAVDLASEKADAKIQKIFQSRGPQFLHRKVLAWWNPPSTPPPPKRHDALPPSER